MWLARDGNRQRDLLGTNASQALTAWRARLDMGINRSLSPLPVTMIVILML